MSLSRVMQLYNFAWSLESHAAQRLSWDDAAQARIARALAEQRAQAQLQAMLDANPSGQLGRAKLNDISALIRSGLLG
jgi:hypothetical protein